MEVLLNSSSVEGMISDGMTLFKDYEWPRRMNAIAYSSQYALHNIFMLHSSEMCGTGAKSGV